jgi:hypothetical protein
MDLRAAANFLLIGRDDLLDETLSPIGFFVMPTILNKETRHSKLADLYPPPSNIKTL